MTADVEKMYRQIWVDNEDRQLQLIWWREQESDEIKCYQLNTVTYGTSAAPYLAIRTLRAMADEQGHIFPLAADCIRKHFYVDDVLCGSDNLLEAVETQSQLVTMFQSTGMKLRKWVANHPRLLEAVPPPDRETVLNFNNDNGNDVKTMGLKWDPAKDLFKLNVGKISSKSITKRTILSDIAHISDPLGIIAPVTASAKILLQQLWKLKLDWDAAIPQQLHHTWNQFREELPTLQSAEVPRHIFAGNTFLSSQLHIFCDASEQAYGAVAYNRTTHPHNVVSVRFLCAKSKVAPVKQITLPRLELCAAKLGAELFKRLQETDLFKKIEVFFWTDSTAVLGWIKAESANYHTFIANRISAIQKLTVTHSWRHVRSEDNPADMLSRGLSPAKLVNNHFWFYGPKFLHGTLSCWPLQPPQAPCTLEIRKSHQTTIASATTCSDFNFLETINHRNSSHNLQSIIATILRFKYPRREKVELENLALIKIVKNMQLEYFKEEIKDLKKHKSVKNGSVISSLTPFLDEDEVIRVGGRLEAANLSFEAKHPILLPSQHSLTKILINTIHQEHHHCGPQTLMSIVRQRFWPLKLKLTARTVVQQCVRCAKMKPKLMHQLMGNLPAERVQPSRPFITSGVDFFGPVWTHFKIRGKKPLKAYVALFCCFGTKAVHMELVNDLTTEAFIAALKRFIARRGHCRKLYSDNATNFVGAKNYIVELQEIIHSDAAKEKIDNECKQKGITFSFIPPRSPHFGGLWEAAVKSAKRLLLNTLSSASLTYEEMETLIIESEAILNSRPLTPMSSNPNDLQALTPGHFLIGEPLTSAVDVGALPSNITGVKRWKLISQLKAEFWQRWVNEYLSNLQHRYKWKKEIRNIEPGTMVIIKEDNVPTMKWPLGKVVSAIPGPDGLVRVADIRTASKIIRRPIHRLAPLPVETQEDGQEDKTKPPSKRRRLTAPLITMLAIMCMLPLCFANPLDIQPFATNPGLYYEKLGTAGITTSEWTLISYVDMRSYWKKLELMSKYPSALRKSSNNSHQNIVRLTEELLEELELRNQIISPTTNKRSKRGAINIIGNIANSLFGILDSTYAEEAEKNIEKIKLNENYLISQLKQQTSFLDATINVVKKGQRRLENEITRMSTYLDQLENTIMKESAFTNLALQAALDMMQLERIQESLIDILMSSHHGKIDPKLISPEQLRSELNKVKANLPAHLRLPASTDKLLNFYKIMNIEGRALKDYIIFKITIDLLTNDDFEVLKIVSVPWQSNGEFYKITSSFEILIINLHRDQYLPLRESELNKCNQIDEEEFICHQHQPLYKVGASVAACEVQLLSHQNNSQCPVQHIGSGPHWIQLQNRNTWIYSVNDKHIVNTVCGATPGQVTLRKSGIIHLQADCNIKQPKVSIEGYKTLETRRSPFYIPNDDIENLIERPTSKITNISSFAHIDEIDDLKRNLSNIQIELPNELGSHDIHHYTATYICVILISVIAGVTYWKMKKVTSAISKSEETSSTTNSHPEPTPRQGKTFITIPVERASFNGRENV